MVGGLVIDTVDCGANTGAWPTGRVWINVRGTGNDRHQTLGIFVERTDAARSVSLGDSVWWQGAGARWTPKMKDGSEPPFRDFRLKRIGASGVARPTDEEIATAARGIAPAERAQADGTVSETSA